MKKKYDRENETFFLEYNLSEIPMANLIKDVIDQCQLTMGPYVKYSPLCVFVSKILLEHRHSICLHIVFVCSYATSTELHLKAYSLQSLKYFLSGPLQKK